MAEAKSAIQVLNNTTMAVQKQIENYCSDGKLNLPKDYSVGNAIKSAQLMIQDNEKIMSCTQSSIAKCLLDMAILGLNPSKQQLYFVPYGNQAQVSISYHGKVAIAKRIDPGIQDIFARVVKKGEDFDFDYDTNSGNTIITRHKPTLESLGSKEIIAAYACVVYRDGRPNKALIMDFDRIKKSWAQSAMHPVDGNGNIKAGTVHDKFTAEMACKTVISAICKPIINQSSDADLFGTTVQSVDLNESKAQADAEAYQKMNTGDFIDIEFSEAQESESGNSNDVSADILE